MFKKLFTVATTAAAVAVPMVASAALSAGDQTSILAGITASDTVFYSIGGGLLVVMAGIWGFKRVKALIS